MFSHELKQNISLINCHNSGHSNKLNMKVLNEYIKFNEYFIVGGDFNMNKKNIKLLIDDDIMNIDHFESETTVGGNDIDYILFSKNLGEITKESKILRIKNIVLYIRR